MPRSDEVEILTQYGDLAPFVSRVAEASDANKNELGFLRQSVFFEFAEREQLFVAIDRRSDFATYAGHLLFDCRFPRATVLQVYATPRFRRRYVATSLLSHLKRTLTDLGFISIYARVAEDLIDANKFWDRQGFYVQRVAQGGVTRGRTILVRSHELASAQLFPMSGVTSANPLGLSSGVGTEEAPVFLIDLNVLFDLGPRRPRTEEAVQLFRAERSGSVRLVISTELTDELRRTATTGRTDPMQAYARIFPAFPLVDGDEWNRLFVVLAGLVFPEKSVAGQLSESDRSDLRHLGTAIQNRLAGLITSDGSVLAAAAKLKERFDIQVASPATFMETSWTVDEAQSLESMHTQTVRLRRIVVGDEPETQRLLSSLNIAAAALASDWAALGPQSGSQRVGIWEGDHLIGYATWGASPVRRGVVARVAVDERSANALAAARALLSTLLSEASSSAPLQIRLETPTHQARLREVAWQVGFRGDSNGSSVVKVALGRIVAPTTWSACKQELVDAGHFKLPDSVPQFRSVDQQIQITRADGNRGHVSLDVLEDLLAPTLFVLPGRTAVITPIQAGFAGPLLGNAAQMQLLPQPIVSIYHSRHYLSDPRNLARFPRGTLMLFYESRKHGGRGAIVAVARVRAAYLKSREALASSDLDLSVLDPRRIAAIGTSKMKTVTVFDNVFHAIRPVPLEELRSLGCGNSNDLLTTRGISDAQLKSIMKQGFDID